MSLCDIAHGVCLSRCVYQLDIFRVVEETCDVAWTINVAFETGSYPLSWIVCIGECVDPIVCKENISKIQCKNVMYMYVFFIPIILHVLNAAYDYVTLQIEKTT